MMSKIFLLVATMYLIETESEPIRHHSFPTCKITFQVNNAGVDVDGEISDASVTIDFDPDDLEKSSLVATAFPASINTGIGIRDKHLRRSDYFDTGKYPEIRLRSKEFQKKGKNAFTGIFLLTIKDKTKEVSIHFTRTQRGDSVRFAGKFEINRLDFDLGERSPILDEIVKISVIAEQAGN